MATNLQIDQHLLEEAQRVGGFKTKRETVNSALDAFIRYYKRQQLLLLQDQIEYEPDYDHKVGRSKR
ncbi:MAG: type II toxin-antitoxin system VapB family antitoxin [Chloroflexota bacterium]